MYVRKKIRFRLILAAVVIFLVIYIHGVIVWTNKNNLDCQWHVVYAVCKQIGKPTVVPSLWDVLVAGVKFKF